MIHRYHNIFNKKIKISHHEQAPLNKKISIQFSREVYYQSAYIVLQ